MSKFSLKPLLAAAIAAAALQPLSAAACGSQPFLGEICVTGYNFCPRGYAEANGQIMPIAQNTALFALLGTQFGGNGIQTFALPDLRGRTAVGDGQGPGLSNIVIGETGGTESITLTQNNLPSHTHTANTSVTVTPTLNAVNAAGNTSSPAGKALAASTARDNLYSSSSPAAAMANGSVTATATANTTLGNVGGSQPFANREPYLGLKHCIAVTGIFPSRN